MVDFNKSGVIYMKTLVASTGVLFKFFIGSVARVEFYPLYTLTFSTLYVYKINYIKGFIGKGCLILVVVCYKLH